MDKAELKFRELQHEEVETCRKLQRLILTKVSKTLFWAKIIISLLCVNILHTHFFTHGKVDYKSEEVLGSHKETKRAFLQAAAHYRIGDIEGMNEALDEMAKTKGFQVKKWRHRNLRYAEANLPEVFVDSFTRRLLLAGE